MESMKAKLLAELEEVQTELARLDESLKERGEYGFGRGDPAIYQWELNLALRERFRQRQQQIQKALQRLEEGSYGICERCQHPIEAERLEALPFTSLCIQCARAVT